MDILFSQYFNFSHLFCFIATRLTLIAVLFGAMCCKHHIPAFLEATRKESYVGLIVFAECNLFFFLFLVMKMKQVCPYESINSQFTLKSPLLGNTYPFNYLSE